MRLLIIRRPANGPTYNETLNIPSIPYDGGIAWLDHPLILPADTVHAFCAEPDTLWNRNLSIVPAPTVRDLFPNHKTAYRYLMRRRWPVGTVCPRCNNTRERHAPVIVGGETIKCHACDTTFTVRTRTVMSNSRLPMHQWLYAIDAMVRTAGEISATDIADRIGVSPSTGYALLTRLRRAPIPYTTHSLSAVEQAVDIIIGRKGTT